MSFFRPVQKIILIFCFFLSGAAGLFFEVLWVRQLTFSLGHTTLAISIVLTAFMTGLALGSFFIGKKADSLSNKQLLLAYGACEIGVGGTGILSTLLIQLFSTHIPPITFGNDSFFFGQFLWFLISMVPLLIPTVLMGATLPLISKWLQLELESWSSGETVGLAYGANTLGAVLGILASGFFLLPVLGLRNCYLLAAALNLLAAVGAGAISSLVTKTKYRSITKTDEFRSGESNSLAKKKMAVLLVLSGAAAMICQVAWTRLFSLVIGSSTYSFSTILLVFLIGLALGSLIFRPLGRLFTPSISNLWILFFFLGMGILTYLPMFNHLPYYFSRMFQFTRNIQSLLFLNFLLCSIVILLPTLLMGMVLPWILASANTSGRKLGEFLGFCYSANTIGAILGSILGGLVFVPWWGSEKTMVVAAWFYVAAMLLVFVFDEESLVRKRIQLALGTLLIFIFVTGLRPTLDPVIMSSGAFIYGPDYSRENSYESFLKNVHDNRLLYYKDGISTTISVLETPWDIRFLRVNGKTDASSMNDMTTQLLLAYLPHLLHAGNPQKALVIGMGSGATLGALSTQTNLQQLDCVEIEPAVVEAAPYFKNINRNVAEDPRVHFIYNDARHYLATTEQKYDIITSEPSNPWIAGISNLFTREAFIQTRDKLTDDGVFCQWFHSYSMGADDFKMVLHTFETVFPHVILFTTGEKDYFLIGSKKAWDVDYQKIEKQFSTNTEMQQDLVRVGLGHPFSLLATTFLLDDKDFREFSKSSQVHVDDKPVLEFSAPKYLHRGEDRLIFADLVASKKEFLPTGFRGLNANVNEWCLLYNMAGEAFMRSRQISQAETAFDIAMTKNPSDARTWVNQARIHNMKNEHLQAEKALRKAIVLDPQYALAQFHLGMLYLDQGLENAGLSALEKGLSLSPGDPMGSLQVGMLYVRQGRREEAKKLIRNALQKPIPNADLYKNLILLLNSIEKPTQKI